ncbi:MAG: hypothetical protein H0W21_04905 [Actinobacteria bacterium]|jgi:hypothetical protein|nr:hypothetical protein [Actinomycetota bacterium]
MKARLATFEGLPAEIDMGNVGEFREWIKSQPGFCGGFHLRDPKTGAVASLTLWDEGKLEEVRIAAEKRQSTHPPVGMPEPTSVVFYDIEWRA